MTPFEVMRYRMAAPTSLSAMILADGPVHYWRNAEASGAVMVDEITTDGQYFSTVSLGNPPIYTGGPTCASNFSNARFGASSVVPVALNAMTLVGVVRLNAVTGFQPVGTNRDQNSGGRKWQWRSNGTALEFVKIVGGVSTISQPAVFTAGVTAMIAITIDSAGNYVMYKNGVSIKTGAVAATNYGGAGDTFTVGFSSGGSMSLNGFACENAVFNKVISGARIAAYATAAGL